MDKLKVLLQKLGIELTADQTKQITEVIEKEFVPLPMSQPIRQSLMSLPSSLPPATRISQSSRRITSPRSFRSSSTS